MKNNLESYPCFVVRTGKKRRTEFIDWLKKEHFELKHTYGWGAPWVHVYLKEKLYVGGKTGIAFGYNIGGHAITIEEFKTIYAIYKKYEGSHFMDCGIDDCRGLD